MMATIPTNSTDLFKLFDQLNAQSYHINPLYIDMTGSQNAGFLLTQLIFLSRGFKHDQFYRTDQQLRDAYRFGSKELINARKTLMSLGVVEAVRKGNPPKWHYRIVIEKIIELSLKMPLCGPKTPPEPTSHMELAETATLNSPKRRHCTRRNGDTNNKLNNDLDNKKENKKKKSAALRPKVAVSLVEEIFEYWQKATNHPKARLDANRTRSIAKALESYTVEDAKKAIDGCAGCQWHRENKHDGIGLIFRNADKIEFFMAKADAPTGTKSVSQEVQEYIKNTPKTHKTAEETKAELMKSVPPQTETVSQERVTGTVKDLKEVLRNEILKSNMERSNVRSHSGRVVPTVEQRNRDSGQEFITPGRAQA
jgi:hypothetical protein